MGLSRQIGKHMVHVGLPERVLQFLWSAHCFDFAVDHDGNAVAIFRLVHIVGGDKDCDAFCRRLVNELPKLPPRSSVNAARRFV